MSAKQRTGAQETFMRWALARIVGTKGHPLAFLVDPVTKTFHSQYGTRHKLALKNEDHPPVQAGHLVSFHGLAHASHERLALQDADFNQEQNYTAERPGIRAIVFSQAVEIGGIPVEGRTAQMWEDLHLLPKGSVAAAPASHGWARSG
jgi:hypothetical protein